MPTKTIFKITAIISLVFVGFAFLGLRPVPILPVDQCEKTIGIVQDIFEGPSSDIVFRISGKASEYFYINRGLENGLDLSELRRELLQNEVVIYYPDHWTILDPRSSSHHILRMDYYGVVLYDETAH